MVAGRSPTEYYSPQAMQANAVLGGGPSIAVKSAASPAALIADRLKPPPASEKRQVFEMPPPPLKRSLAKTFDEEFQAWKQGRSEPLPWAKPGFSPHLLKELEEAGEEAADRWNKTGVLPSPCHPAGVLSHAEQLALRQQKKEQARGRGRGRSGRGRSGGGGRGRAGSNNSSHSSGDEFPVVTPPHVEAVVPMETPAAAPASKAPRPKTRAAMKRPAAKTTEDGAKTKKFKQAGSQSSGVGAEAEAEPEPAVDGPVTEPVPEYTAEADEPNELDPSSEPQRGPTKAQRADLREPFDLHMENSCVCMGL